MAMSQLFTLPKYIRFVETLGGKAVALGTLEYLKYFAEHNADDGDLTKYTDADIELAVGWSGPSGVWIEAAIKHRFIDRDSDGTRIHDWAEWAPRYIKERLRLRELRASETKDKQVRNDCDDSVRLRTTAYGRVRTRTNVSQNTRSVFCSAQRSALLNSANKSADKGEDADKGARKRKALNADKGKDADVDTPFRKPETVARAVAILCEGQTEQQFLALPIAVRVQSIARAIGCDASMIDAVGALAMRQPKVWPIACGVFTRYLETKRTIKKPAAWFRTVLAERGFKL